MSKFSNIPKFNFANGYYCGVWQESDFDYFVDTEFGSNSNNGRTPATAFKTLSKLSSLAAGITVAFWGIDTTPFSLTKKITIIGAGGHNGRAVINTTTTSTISNTTNYTTDVLANIEVIGNIILGASNASGSVIISKSHAINLVNCMIESCQTPITGGGGYIFNMYNCIIGTLMSSPANSSDSYVYLTGRNNTIKTTKTTPPYTRGNIYIYGDNYHQLTYSKAPNTAQATNLLYNTDARFFTDNTETIPADLYIDSAAGNYGIVEILDTPIWDKQTQQYITANPLYNTGSYNPIERRNNNIGAGVVTLSLNANNAPLKSIADGGDAIYTNMESNANYEISRIQSGSDGTVQSGIIDLGKVVSNIAISAISTYSETDGVITDRLQESTPSSTQGMDFYVQFGLTETDCSNMTPILCEYGKPITYCVINGVMYGNSDPMFQADLRVYPEFRYIKIQIKAQTFN